MSDIVNSSLKSAVKGSTIVFLGMVASILLWFATKVLIIRNTTKEELGIYSIVIAVVGVLSLLAGFGIQEGVPRYISLFLGEAKKSQAKAISRTAIITGLISGTAFLLFLLIFSGPIARYVFYKPELRIPLLIISFFIPLSVISNNIVAILRGYNMIYPKVFFSDIGQPFFFLLLLGLFFMMKLSFTSIFYAYTISMLLVLLLMGAYYLIKIDHPQPQLEVSTHRYVRELIKFSAPLLMASILGIVLTWCDTLMLGRYTRAEEVGLYNVSISLAKLLTFPLSALEFVYLPIAGELYIKKQFSELGRTYQVLTKWNFLATLPIFIVLFFFPEMTITFLFGVRFLDSSSALRILSFCFLFHAFLGANGLLLIIMGRSKTLMHISIFGVLLNIFFNYILIKHFGLGKVGASVATLISYLALNIIISLILYRISSIHPLTPQYIKPIILSSVIGLAIYAVAKSLPLYVWMLPVYLLMYIAGYFISLRITKSFEEDDIQMFEIISEKTGFKMNMIRKFLYSSIK
ncbi:MAG: flippase [Dissulfurispiraceae bacterium]|jgi:O-antigen/teichoic acid export membrane protein